MDTDDDEDERGGIVLGVSSLAGEGNGTNVVAIGVCGKGEDDPIGGIFEGASDEDDGDGPVVDEAGGEGGGAPVVGVVGGGDDGPNVDEADGEEDDPVFGELMGGEGDGAVFGVGGGGGGLGCAVGVVTLCLLGSCCSIGGGEEELGGDGDEEELGGDGDEEELGGDEEELGGPLHLLTGGALTLQAEGRDAARPGSI